MNTKPLLQTFRELLYRILPKRADALLDLIDALTVARHVASPVALSEEPPFRRTHSMVYDVLTHAELAAAPLQEVLTTAGLPGAETLAGYELYALDTTPDVRPEADTAPDRGLLKAQKQTPAQPGHKFSWLVRLVQTGTSWVAPWDVRRVPTTATDNTVGAAQVAALAAQAGPAKVVVADSLYANHHFLRVFGQVQQLFALVRLRRNLNLYEAPPPPEPGKRGAPKKHGAKFKMATPARPPDRTATLCLGRQEIQLRAWHGLHLRQLAQLVGVALQIEFLKADGTPRYKRPLWVFWTGPETVPLPELCRMYLWRFAIEHSFRFMKQHLGLTAHRLTDPAAIQRWVRLCALAYTQLLLMRHEVESLCPAWYPARTMAGQRTLTPGQVQRGAARFLQRVGTPAATPRNAGKGHGRATGYRPAPRPRHAVVRKSPKPAPKPATPAVSVV